MAFTSNKCVEGLPGLSFTVAPIERLLAGAGQAGSWSLDLGALYSHALQSGWGSHRFTPPRGHHRRLRRRAGPVRRGGRPAGPPGPLHGQHARALYDGVQTLGLTPMLPQALQGPIVMNVAAPPDPAWNLQRFVDGLKARASSSATSTTPRTPSMRIGCIGAIAPDDMRRAVTAMGDVLSDMRIQQRHAA